jgi:hypothetical protein
MGGDAMSSKNPIVIRIPAVVDIRVDTREASNGDMVDERVLRLIAEELGDDWFNLSKEHACMDLAEVGAGCSLEGFDMFIDEDGNSPLINETATLIAAREGVCVTGDAFLATTPQHDEEANETYTPPCDVDLVNLAYDIRCTLGDDFQIYLEAVEVTFDGVTSSSKDYWEPDIEGEKERRATGHSHLD